MAINKEIKMEEAILEAATKLFLEKGFKATSTTEIAKEVGCNQALVHYYYRTKERLFDSIFAKKMKIFAGSLLKIEQENLSFKSKLKRVIESQFDVIRADPKFPLLFFHEINANPDRLVQLKEKLGNIPELVMGSLKTELENEIAKGNIRPMGIHDLLMTIVSLNIAMFITAPVFKMITEISEDDFTALVDRRKKENVHIIMSSILPESVTNT